MSPSAAAAYITAWATNSPACNCGSCSRTCSPARRTSPLGEPVLMPGNFFNIVKRMNATVDA